MLQIISVWPNFPLAILAVGIGLSMVGLKEFKNARICFWAAAIIFSIGSVGWQLTTPAPLLARVTYGIIATFLVGILFPRTLIWVNRREAESQPPS
jgi:hypothetical protein